MGSYKWWLLAYQLSSSIFDFSFNVIVMPVIFFPIPMGYADSAFANWVTLSADAALFIFAISFVFIAVSTLNLFIYRCHAIIPQGYFLKTDTRGLVINGVVLFLIYFVPVIATLANISPDQDEAKKWALKVRLVINGVVLFLVYFVPVIATLANISPDQEEAKKWALKEYSCARSAIDAPRLHIYTLDKIYNAIYAVTVLASFSGFVGSMTIALSFYFLAKASAMSQKTKRMQKRFLIALCIQILIPLFTLLIPITIMLWGRYFRGTTYFWNIHGVIKFWNTQNMYSNRGAEYSLESESNMHSNLKQIIVPYGIDTILTSTKSSSSIEIDSM
ncbi:unnamed protein product [Strongylus vulgaris]|uniref:Uncharacterized protein n=1 Tax=Strongylus vulgaris TaxID=40348 RepID=A0A3P7JMG4_STRVU|nr:unnamed protein product [Strongylus vulgaris]